MDHLTEEELSGIYRETLERTPIALGLLRDSFDTTNAEIAEALGQKVSWVEARMARRGTKLSFPDARLFAALFGCPIDLLYATKTEVRAWVGARSQEDLHGIRGLTGQLLPAA